MKTDMDNAIDQAIMNTNDIKSYTEGLLDDIEEFIGNGLTMTEDKLNISDTVMENINAIKTLVDIAFDAWRQVKNSSDEE